MADGRPQIEDYEPRHSIVITPTKMARYYEKVRVVNESSRRSSMFWLGRRSMFE